MDKLQDEIQNGHYARQLKENPLLAEFFSQTREKLTQAWMASDNPDYREDVWRFVQVLKQFEKHIDTYLQTGQMAEIQLQEIQRNVSNTAKH